MPDNKEHHYVPQIYLKNFSLEGTNNKLIKGIRKSDGKIIPNAIIKTESKKTYFYGKDGIIEKVFGDLEGKIAKIYKKIISYSVFPNQNTEDFEMIRFFTFLQANRTLGTSKGIDNMMNSFVQGAFGNHPNFNEIENTFISINDSVLLQLENTIDGYSKYCLDLKGKFLINETSTPFITSDNPAVKYNQFLEKRKFPNGITGIALRGFQVFYPISPNIMVIFYDSYVYRIGTNKSNIISIGNLDDINELNKLQVANANEVIYNNGGMKDEDFLKVYNSGKQYTPHGANRHEYLEEKGNGKLLIVHTESIKTNLTLTFIKENSILKSYQMSGSAVELRKKEWYNKEQ